MRLSLHIARTQTHRNQVVHTHTNKNIQNICKYFNMQKQIHTKTNSEQHQNTKTQINLIKTC